MAWTAPPTYVSGAILTAAQMDAISENLLAGGPIYTTEAARNTAIPAPFEGQRAYLTAPTVPAATGATTIVPTGIETVYNGSAWVCVTPVSAYSTTSGTTTSGTPVTTLTGDATAVSVTLTTGTRALIMAHVQGSVSAISTLQMQVSVSGATTISAASSIAAAGFANDTAGYNMTFPILMMMGGLTAGNNTFTLNYSVSAATGTYVKRHLTVQGIM
jgi:hypothetical protein